MRLDETDESVSIFRYPSNNANGNTIDLQGRLVTCEHLTRRVTRTEHDGSLTVMAERVGEYRLNSPNDAVVKSDGSVWFTDPTYGIDGDYEGSSAPSELPGCFVYRVDPLTMDVSAVITDRVQPNGIAFSPDENTLYVSDTGAADAGVYAYEMTSASGVGPAQLVCQSPNGVIDGFRVDCRGHLWTSAGDGVSCYTSSGTRLGHIDVGETVANVCFGGPKRNRLYICAQSSLYAIFLGVRGMR
jgi:gluconolactonase